MDKHTIMKKHVKNWQKSGKSIRAYCRENDITVDSFSNWRYKYAKETVNHRIKTILPIKIEEPEPEFSQSPLEVSIQIENNSVINIRIRKPQ